MMIRINNHIIRDGMLTDKKDFSMINWKSLAFLLDMSYTI